MRNRSIFLCPSCERSLQEAADRYVCSNGHAFDRARSGYVNLRQTARRGDTSTMLQARRTFLERGFFRPISDAINATAVDHLTHLAASRRLRHEVIVDVGCGEGYYLRSLSGQLEGTAFSCMPLVGLDASKQAARSTAATVRGQRCAVVDVARGLLLRPATTAVLLNVFAPRNPAAFAEALMAGGLCLVVIPRPEHMQEVRELMPAPLNIPSWKQDWVEQQFGPHLDLRCVQDLIYPVRLDGEAVRAWIEMGPNAWQATHQQLTDLQRVGAITTEVACTLLSFVRVE